MAVQDNAVFSAAKQMKTFRKPSAEMTIFVYAKLLSMNEKMVVNFISPECMEDFETAHKWFEDNNLNLGLIKTGMGVAVMNIPADEYDKKEEVFVDFLESGKNTISSKEILAKALECAYIPVKKLFASGSSMDEVFKYQSELAEKFPHKSDDERDDEDKEEEEKPKKKEEETKPKKKEEKSGEKEDKPKEKEDKLKSGESKKADEKQDENAEIETRELGTLSEKYRDLTLSLLDVVKGQDQAILKFVQGFNQGELLKNTGRGKHPKSYFFFFGPPGVGKTLLAETAADTLGIPYKIFNMSEYASNLSLDELIGTSSAYSNAREGTLVKFVRQNPECLLVFDEIEKAHIHVIRQFLQILGSGSLHNVKLDEETSFQDVTIIFTSNVGRELYEDRSVNLATLPEKVLIDAIQKEVKPDGTAALPPEICSRIASGNTILFNHLSVHNIAELAKMSFDNVIEGMKKEFEIRVTYAKELPLLFLFSRGDGLDARVAVSQSAKFIKNEIFEVIRQMQNSSVDINEVKKLHFDIDWKGMSAELKRLFKNEDKAEVLIFSDKEKMFESLGDNIEVHRAVSITEAKEYEKSDLTAVYIDPFFGLSGNDDSVLSISDYNTEGVKLFHELVEKQSGLPIFLLEMDRKFSDVDRRTFLQEGARGTALADSKRIGGFKRQFSQIMDDLYMEKESQVFSQRGWVIDYFTRQAVVKENGEVRVEFYNLRKKMALDLDSSKSILSVCERPNVKFSDVIGAEKAKEELQYFVQYLQNPKRFMLSGGRPPKGVLLYGPPGTGKTLLARAMAGESDVTFLQTSAAEFKNKYVGESEASIRRLFARAKKYAPAIIFIDEIDAIGKQRTGTEFTHVTDSMLNTLLTEMDGFSSGDIKKPIFVLAATNFGVGKQEKGISSLDAALVRRFDGSIYVGLPKTAEREEYLHYLIKKKNVDTISDEAIHNLADRTTGQSLAILQNVFESAQRDAVKKNRKMEDADLLTALENYLYGEKKDQSPEYYKEVAIHEIGHAYVSYTSGIKPSYITIESRGNFGGYMQPANRENVTGYTREDLLAKIRISLAGRAGEQVFFGMQKSLNTGAESDLENATFWAWQILCTYGMEENQLIVLSKKDILNSTLASEYVAKVNKILNEEMKNTVDIIEKNKEKIQELADALVKENRLTGEQFDELMKGEATV